MNDKPCDNSLNVVNSLFSVYSNNRINNNIFLQFNFSKNVYLAIDYVLMCLKWVVYAIHFNVFPRPNVLIDVFLVINIMLVISSLGNHFLKVYYLLYLSYGLSLQY